ncbi:hypothetical protein [Hydrogenophaga sp.]|uniref:hypothetical protein n=1 Tax=Hydrogenophaga sp. TaxID=1904254 RepID=UPI0035AEF6E1
MDENSKLNEKHKLELEITLQEKILYQRYCSKYNLDKSTVFSIMLQKLLKEDEETEKQKKFKAQLDKSREMFKQIKKL